jgi:endonuclease-3
MQKDLSKIFRVLRENLDRPAVVSGRDPFKVLVSTVLSQRTRDSNTKKASEQLFSRLDSAEKISKAPLKKIQRLIKPAGFYRVKAARIKEISKAIVKEFRGEVPNSLQGLVSLPGVGRKTANCVLVYGFQVPAMPVDVHVHRISNRIGLVKTQKPEQTEFALMELIPKRNWLEFNHLMVRYGQKVCLPRNPKCGACGIRGECDCFSQTPPKKQV